MARTKTLGEFGEALAEGYLAELGYGLLARRYKRGGGEIDLVMTAPDGYLVFVEVKYRRNLSAGAPRLAVGARKKAALRDCAAWYIMENNVVGDMRFDVVEIVGEGTVEIEHIINAF